MRALVVGLGLVLGPAALPAAAGDPPAAEFGVSRSSGTAPLSVSFTDLSSGSVTGWSWDFGDGTGSADASPTHVYEEPGTYDVTLAVDGPAGSDALTKPAFVTVLAASPTARWSASPARGGAPLVVAFDDLSSGTITNRLWDFGDGTTSPETSPVHTYAAVGTYTVGLIVLGPGGFDVHEEVDSIRVDPPYPVADFAAVGRRGRPPLSAAFEDRSTGEITSWSWDFGDGSTSAERSPVHVYRTPGTYAVSLTVAGPDGSDVLAVPDLIRVRGEETRIRLRVPSEPSFVLQATVPVEPRRFDRTACPFTVFDPDGRPLPTQWERVAETQGHLIVELLAPVVNHWSGEVDFAVRETHRPTPMSLAAFDPAALELALASDGIVVRVEDQAGGTHEAPLSGITAGTSYFRHGPVAVTTARHVDLGVGWMHAWLTARAGSPELELVLNWHDGGLPARPDAYFRSLSLELAPGWTWTPLLPDPAAATPYLVAPDDHVLPQRMERSFRVIVHPAGTVPSASLSRAGFGVGDWSRGGYLAQDLALPDLGHVAIDLEPVRRDAYQRLAANQATIPGNPPVSPLWPARGVLYGGMTGGIDVEQFPGVSLAASGDPAGLLALFVEELRYGARQMGCIYRGDGRPVRLDDHLAPDGSAPWDLFNSRFQGNPPHDAPFGFSLTGPGQGFAPYDPEVFDPIDNQHLIRRTKANKVLAWLANDPLARLHVEMDAELSRMTFHEGPHGRLQVPATPGQGCEAGRAEAWAADVLAHAWALGDGAWRARNRAWFERFVQVLATAQMPSGLFSARRTGKTATDAPYGDGTTAFYWVHRSNEQVFLIHALVAVEATVGIPTADLVRRAAQGLWDLAWKPGASGPLGRYPAGPIGGPRYATSAEIPAGLTDPEAADDYQVGNGLAWGQRAGATLLPAVLHFTRATSLGAALAALEARGLDNVENWVALLDVLREELAETETRQDDARASR